MRFDELKDEQWDIIKAIYKEAFPKVERKPFSRVKKAFKNGNEKIYTACEDGNVMGFAMIIPYKNTVLVDYLAVNDMVRGRGTGGYLLHELERELDGKKIVLLIEKVDDTADNADQRRARRKFYLRNGFVSSSVFVTGKSGDMEVMVHGGKVSGTEVMELMHHALGSWMFKMSKMKVCEA